MRRIPITRIKLQCGKIKSLAQRTKVSWQTLVGKYTLGCWPAGKTVWENEDGTM